MILYGNLQSHIQEEKTKMNATARFAIAAAASALAAAIPAFADGEAPEYPELSATFGGTLNKGNTEDESANLAIDFKDVLEGFEYTLGANGNITRTTVERTDTGEDGSVTKRKDKETTAKNGEAKGKILIPIKAPFSAYIDGSAFRDEIADIDYRFMVGPGIAWDIVKSDDFDFALELGISPMWEKTAGETEYYTTLRLAERMEKRFAKGAKVWEQVEYLPALNESDKYLVNAEVGAESPLNDRLSLHVTLKDKYNSLPADGNDKNDLSLIAGIRVKL